MPNAPVARKPRRWVWWMGGVFITFVVGHFFLPKLFMSVGYKPLVYNESIYGHVHCIGQIAISLNVYANDNGGRYPSHTNGYGDALLMMFDLVGGQGDLLSGPCYRGKVFEDAFRLKSDVPESECGRVYVQGLTDSSHPDIVLVFDKQPTHGGDHTHGWHKLSAPLGREVKAIGHAHRFISEREWPEFARKQIELLVEAGIPRERALALYTEKPKYTPGLTAEQLTAKQ